MRRRHTSVRPPPVGVAEHHHGDNKAATHVYTKGGSERSGAYCPAIHRQIASAT